MSHNGTTFKSAGIGQRRAVCVCGWQSVLCDTLEQATAHWWRHYRGTL